MRQKNGSSRFNKGIIVSIDAFLALLLLSLVFTVGFVAMKTLAERYALSKQASAHEMTLMAFADRLVKEEITRADNERVFQHEIDVNKAKTLGLNEWKNKTGLSELSVQIEKTGGIAWKTSGNSTDCVKRVVVVEGEIGVLRVCG